MAQGDPIKRNFCTACGKPNAVGVTVCRHCGAPCESRIIGYANVDEEDKPKETSAKRPLGNLIPL